MSQARRSTRKKRQTQLSFTPLPSSSPAASQYPDQLARRAASVRYGESPTKKQRITDVKSSLMHSSPAKSSLKAAFEKQKIQVMVPSPSRKPSQLPTPEPSSQLDGAIDASDGQNSSKKASRKQIPGAKVGAPVLGAAASIYEGGGSRVVTSEDDVTHARSSRKPNTKQIVLSSEEECDPYTPIRRPLKRGTRVHKTVSSSDESLVGLSISPRKQLKGDQPSTATRQVQKAVTKSATPKVDTPLLSPDENEASLSEDEIMTPARRRSIRASVDTPSRDAMVARLDESDSLKDEVADLRETSVELRKTRTRGRQDNSERSKRQRKLEELRQRRAQNGANAGSDCEYESVENESSSEPESIDYSIRRHENLDEYDSEFLDDEDETPLGVDLGVAGVPIELTYHANKKPFEHFKTEVEWMVHNKINPAFDRRDEIYLLAHRKLDDEVRGLGLSKYSSAAWKQGFLDSLKSRPDIYTIGIPTMIEYNKCDACSRSGHPPKLKITLKGKRYNRDTLEPIERDDEEDDDGDEEEKADSNASHGSEHEETFFLGRFCCANAEMAHALFHWRYNLNDTVLVWLASEGHLTPEKIVARERKSQKQRDKEANRVVDGMVTNGVMRELYHQFKQNLEAARDSRPKNYGNRH